MRLTSSNIVVALIATFLFAPLGASAATWKSRPFEAIYRGVVTDIPAGTKTLKVWVPLPTSRAYQAISEARVIESPYSWKTHTDPFGNRYVTTTIKRPPAGEFVVKVRFRGTRHEARMEQISPVKLTRNELTRDLKANRLVTLSPRVRNLADEVTAGADGPIAQARAIYDHLLATMKYDKTTPGWGRGDTERACDVRSGNCTDFHSLFMSLARAKGIPVRFVIGFPFPPGAGSVAGYHCWAEFYAENRWIPVDASDAAKSNDPVKRNFLFGNLDSDRVEVTTGRDLVLVPPTKEPLNFFIYPYVEADGVPIVKGSLTLEVKEPSSSLPRATITVTTPTALGPAGGAVSGTNATP